ncbi:hypothetical protein HII12_001575 [Brettanomyces bruxellensis]|uniref:Ubiquitin-like protease family profile domain-containing protein n=1 Tax=Dekkera bruxellensis TaxID=5007 RepID=A0A8H6BLH1_DEKBR|nr:hypothetical protein HII12_001575 [Brettanomyces bruxellensis]
MTELMQSMATDLKPRNRDYNTLPTFAKRRFNKEYHMGRNQASDSEDHVLLLDSPEKPSRKGTLPQFVPEDRSYADSLLESAINEARQRSFLKEKPQKVSSSGKTLFSNRINGMFRSFTSSIDNTEADIKNQLSHKIRVFSGKKDAGIGPQSSVGDSDAAFVSFVKLLCMALLCLGKKLYAWAIFFLIRATTWLLSLINKVPTPSTNSERVSACKTDPKPPETIQNAKNDTDLSVSDLCQSTPVKKQKNLPKVKLNDRKTSNITAFANAISGQDPFMISPSKDHKDYGTFFYHNESPASINTGKKENSLKSVTESLNFNDEQYLPKSNIYQDKNDRQLKRAQEIKNNLLHFYNMPADKNWSTIQTPSFTRSSERLKDLEWIKDDDVDYLHNLESTELFKEYKKIMEERLNVQRISRLKKLKEKAKVKPLNEDQLSMVENWWDDAYSSTAIINKFNIGITYRDMFTLSDRKWLNDNRGYQGVRKWAKRAKVDVTTVDYVFVPINIHSSHWALGLVNNKEHAFQYFDSLFGTGGDILDNLQSYMIEETKRLYGESMNGIDYSRYEVNPEMPCPTQQNGFDCGVFTCTMAEYLSRNMPLLFSQEDMPLIRRRMAYEIGTGKLLQH